MRKMILILLTVVFVSGLSAIALVTAGCSAEFPVKWKPTEPQKQAADLAVKDILALKPHTAPAAEPIRAEAQQAAEITQTYIGLPKQRPQSNASVNRAVLDQAAADAARPPPIAGQVGKAIVDEASKAASTGFNLAELLLSTAGGIAGIWGLGKVKYRFDGWKGRAGRAETKVTETLEAFREVVSGIDALEAETRKKVKAAQQQSARTKRLVAEAKES